jgi:UDP-N-acetylglucosamine 2-epimerase (non-hydrolysing)
MRILTIIGTRPEALKMGPVIRVLADTPGIESLVCATGQHRELVRSALGYFGVAPDFSLTLRRAGPEPEALAAALLARLGPLVQRVRPEWILAVGDTTSVLAASLVAAHQRVRFAHVEAGLRTAAKLDPFPEEINRRVATVLADLHLAPTAGCRRNLRREGIPARAIAVTGNPGIDALNLFARQTPPAGMPAFWRRLGLEGGTGTQPRLVLVTFHRRENIGRPMREICAALRTLAETYRSSVRILCIIHPNPAVREPARRDLAGQPYIVLSRPLAYPVMVAVLKRTQLVLTDSGGLQEEAPGLQVPVLVLRNCTERPEGVAAGVAALVGTAHDGIVTAVRRVLDRPAVHQAMSRGYRGYGDGHAAGRIVRALQTRHRFLAS